MRAIFRKEMADYLTSVRCFVLFLLALLITAMTLFAAYQNVRGAGTGELVFLSLFTTEIPNLPLSSLLTFVNFSALFFIPIVAIILGFDAINRERSDRTLSRILSQPVFRDSVINGKFLASVTTLSMMMVIAILLISGYGLRMIGVPPSSEEIIRLFIYVVLIVIYGAFWIGSATLFSVLFRSMATSILFSLALWLVFGVGTFVAALAAPMNISQILIEFSPSWLFLLASGVLLQPQLGAGIMLAVTGGTIYPQPLSLGQSLLLLWPQLTLLVSLTLICFAVSYVVFMRQEIRAT